MGIAASTPLAFATPAVAPILPIIGIVAGSILIAGVTIFALYWVYKKYKLGEKLMQKIAEIFSKQTGCNINISYNKKTKYGFDFGGYKPVPTDDKDIPSQFETDQERSVFSFLTDPITKMMDALKNMRICGVAEAEVNINITIIPKNNSGNVKPQIINEQFSADLNTLFEDDSRPNNRLIE